MKIQKKHIVLASLVLALGAAVYINWQISAAPEQGTKELGKATYVNSNLSTTVDEVSVNFGSNLSKEQQNYFSNARLKRDKASDEVKNIALEALSLTEADDDAKEDALAQLATLEELLMNQVSVENTLIAKGFSDCVCAISDGSITIIVPDNEMLDNSALIINDVVAKTCKTSFENISIVTV